MAEMRSKYRVRTRIRGALPRRLGWIAPKGAGDCGAHEWYLSEPQIWRCYHCEVGVSHESPWTADEELRVRETALVEALRYLNHRPLSDETIAERQLVLDQLSDLVTEEREFVSA